MQFTYGDKCWNGPDRSLTVLHINAISQAISFLIKNVLQQVRLRCGLKNELTDVDEPSRCEYDLLSSLLFPFIIRLRTLTSYDILDTPLCFQLLHYASKKN